jgi:predicted GNAT family N-acyltransferase
MLIIKEIKPADTWQLRHTVMWPNRPLSYVQLSEDEKGLHFGLFKEERIISVVSLFIEDEIGQFRKFATENAEQGKGYGSMLLNQLIKEATERGVKILWCNARQTAANFYQKFGLEVSSEKWLQGGIEYVRMTKNL